MQLSDQFGKMCSEDPSVRILGSASICTSSKMPARHTRNQSVLRDTHTKVAVVTGASSGIGEIAALRLAEAGCRVVMLGRNPDRSLVAFERIRAAVPAAQVTLVLADLSIMAHVIRAADEISACVDHVDILVNNAGAIHRTRQMTPENLEGTFAGNYLGPFILTLRLLPLLRAAGNARIINVSSVGHRMIRDMMWDDLQMSRAFDGSRAYFQSKLGNILFTKELSRRVKSDGIVVNAMHPGMVASNFPRTGDWKTKVAYALSRPFQSTVADGADTIVWLALDPQGDQITGQYFVKRRTRPVSESADSAENAARLWEISEVMAAPWLVST